MQSYICRPCLRILLQTRNLKKKIGDLNAKLLIKYQENTVTKSMLVNRKACNPFINRNKRWCEIFWTRNGLGSASFLLRRSKFPHASC